MMTVVHHHGHGFFMAEDRSIPAGEFKAQCLRLMDEVNRTHRSIVITKRGKPVARLVPAASTKATIFGAMKGTVTIHDDIVEPLDIEWEACR
jgi:prevent-host-death family protein